ncbi:MAG: radical SAM protein [Chloroflexaceae bacterium]|nr:radical SAM protein [Chloroflexaceae bacterium]
MVIEALDEMLAVVHSQQQGGSDGGGKLTILEARLPNYYEVTVMVKSLVLSVSYRCPIKCRYCGVYAGPHERDRMSLAFMREVMDQAQMLGVIRVVVFTGGEPFMLGKDLYEAVRYATQLGFLTRIVTNAYWATSYERARSVLTNMQEAGLSEINYSCDDFHQEFIPARFNKTAHNNPPNNVISFGYTLPIGWQSEELTSADLLYASQEHVEGPCTSVLESIVISPSGDVAICCGIGSEEIPETRIGNIHTTPLIDILDAGNRDVMVNWLALEGPAAMKAYIQHEAPDIPFDEQYVNMCHLCHDILTRPECRSVLEQGINERALLLATKRAAVELHRADLYANAVERQHHE